MKTILFFILVLFYSFVWGQNEQNLTNELAKRLGEMQKAEVKQEIDKSYLMRGFFQYSWGNLDYRFYTYEKSLISYVKENANPIGGEVTYEIDTVGNFVRFKSIEKEIMACKVGNWDFVTAKTEKNSVYSFLAGCIIRFGEFLDEETCYITSSTFSKIDECQNALMVTGCLKYFYEKYDNIPASYRLCFKVSDELRYYLDECRSLTESNRKDKKSYQDERFGDGVTERTLESLKVEKKKIIELISN